MSKRILLVEDDYALAMGTEYTLKAEGYEVESAKNLAEAREKVSASVTGADSDLKNTQIDLILLDVMLPDGDGFSYLEELGAGGLTIPVIFCTAVGDEANIVRGLELGADDYVTKPYRVKELLARITAVLRRKERTPAAASDESVGNDTDFTFGTHTFSFDKFRLYDGGEQVDCTPAELRLLKEFIQNYGIVLTRNTLMERLYDTESTFVDDNTLSVYVKRLRDKLGSDAEFIKTVKGIGYRFEQ